MRRIKIQPKARHDLLDSFGNLFQTVGPGKAAQFQSNALRTFLDLARMPHIGAPRKVERDRFRDLRMWRIRDFEEYLVFYSVEPELIRIGRVIHAKRDYKREL